jgi:hypothetical protein
MLLARPCILKGMNMDDSKYREGQSSKEMTGSGETGLISA